MTVSLAAPRAPKPSQSPCPRCAAITDRLDIMSSRFMHVDYFRCAACNHVWKSARNTAGIHDR